VTAWVDQALAAACSGEPLALVSVVAAEGSTPREAGARMLVGEDRAFGTIGGGALEHQAMAQARRLLAQPSLDWALQDYPLGPFLQQCCGGHVRLLLERIDGRSAGWLGQVRARIDAGRPADLVARFDGPRLERSVRDIDQWVGALDIPMFLAADGRPLVGRRPRPGDGDSLIERLTPERSKLILFGAGHVGQAVAHQFMPLAFDLDWFDSRPEDLPPGAAWAEESQLEAVAAAAPAGAYILIMTHSHDLDYRLTRAALGSRATYVGLIGSATKRVRFLRRLADDGVDATALTCPIGLPSLKSKAPEVIAVGVAAQLLELAHVG